MLVSLRERRGGMGFVILWKGRWERLMVVKWNEKKNIIKSNVSTSNGSRGYNASERSIKKPRPSEGYGSKRTRKEIGRARNRLKVLGVRRLKLHLPYEI